MDMVSGVMGQALKHLPQGQVLLKESSPNKSGDLLNKVGVRSYIHLISYSDMCKAQLMRQTYNLSTTVKFKTQHSLAFAGQNVTQARWSPATIRGVACSLALEGGEEALIATDPASPGKLLHYTFPVLTCYKTANYRLRNHTN